MEETYSSELTFEQKLMRSIIDEKALKNIQNPEPVNMMVTYKLPGVSYAEILVKEVAYVHYGQRVVEFCALDMGILLLVNANDFIACFAEKLEEKEEEGE